MDLDEVIHCRNCVWFSALESFPEAIRLHEKLTGIFEGCLKKREGQCGVCRKVTFCAERPVLTHEEGFCHRAQRRA